MKMKEKKIIISLFFIIIFSFIIPKSTLGLDFSTGRIYKEPGIIQEDVQGGGLDDMIKDAEEFEKEKGATAGTSDSQGFKINQGKLQTFSSSLFSILLISATALSIIIGLIIGIKYMYGSSVAKAKYKELLLPYLAGCAVIYGALGMWKLVVTILSYV